jgi:hypothetical protein
MAGYSGRPLAQKLGLKPPLDVLVIGAPDDYRVWLGDLPAGVSFVPTARRTVSAAHVFVSRRTDLVTRLTHLRRRLQPEGFVWVSWPKKSSGMTTDVTEDTIREIALPLGFVDVKVCAVTDVWSGLKLVIRRSERR